MNRRAKRQKYRRLQEKFRKYVRMIEMKNIFTEQKTKEIVTLNCAIELKDIHNIVINSNKYITGYITSQFARAIAERKDELVQKKHDKFGVTTFSVQVVKP